MAFKLTYPDQFALSNGKWHTFTSPHWTCLGHDLDVDLTTFLTTRFCPDLVEPVYRQMRHVEIVDKTTYDKWGFKCSKRYFLFRNSYPTQLFGNLGSHLKKSHDFVTALGTKTHLLGFRDNVVYDTRRHMFRPALPANMLHWSTPHRHVDILRADTAIEKAIWQFLLDCMGGQIELAHYLIDLFSYAISGVRQQHFFVVFEGSGGNGKTLFITLMATALGDYMT